MLSQPFIGGGVMTDFTREEIRSQLHMQGFDPPEPECTEVVYRINALIEGLKKLDDLDVYHIEPWPRYPPGTARGAGAREPSAHDVWRSGVCQSRRADERRSTPPRGLAPRRHLRRQDLERRSTHRPPGRTAHEVRAAPQPQDRHGARDHDSADGAHPGRRGDSLSRDD